MNKKKIIIGGVAVVATGGLGYLGYRLWQKYKSRHKSNGPAAPGYFPPTPYPLPASLPSTRTLPTPGARPNNSKPANTSVFPLKKGSQGDRVKMVQKFLNYRFDSGLDVDGIWGNDTENALKAAGQPTAVTEAGYKVLEFAMKNLGLAGQSTFKRII
jgi:hypothetical protein